MQKPTLRFASLLCMYAFIGGVAPAIAEKMLTLETTHYRVAYEKKHEQMAGEVLKVAESVWPTLAKAYDAYDNYQRIDIKITDEGDDANGYAIYNFSRVAIFAPHMDWVMRNRQAWIRNVVTHELAHVFSLRRAAFLSPVDAVELYGSTYNYTDKINYSFHLPWIPLVAPTWYVEGIAQFEAYMNGNDTWDSQRDMVVRDAYLTGTLPTLDFIETFEGDEDWTQAERCYNTGYAFLIYLKDRFGEDKVRDLARPKPLANFSYSVHKAFGRSLPDLFEDWKKSLADRYADFKEIPKDTLADIDMVGGFQQNLAFSPDGEYMAWLGNADNRRYPLNWIYWKKVKGGSVAKSASPVDKPASAPATTSPGPDPMPVPSPAPDPKNDGFLPGNGSAAGSPGFLPRPRFANPAQALGRGFGPFPGGPVAQRLAGSGHGLEGFGDPEARRSKEYGSSGLEFNNDNTRLLTTRQGPEAQFTDIWEYEFRANKSEEDKWHRLTWEERAAYPSYHPTRKLIVYSRKNGGSSNLTLLDSAGRNWQITNFSNGEQVYNPRFTPRGDSIYFTFGAGEKEAIASINADAPGFNPFLAVKDSALFPDSLVLAKSQKLTFITPMRAGAIRNLRFSNDTLLWSANNMDSAYSVYDVYARIPGDSTVYRATHVAGQATEPVVHGGELYYQGYHRQQFRIYRQNLALTRTGMVLGAPTDSLPLAKPKKEDYTKSFETGEYSGRKVALDITPFLAVQPVFISGDKSYSDLALGLNVSFGEAYGAWQQSVSGALTKRTSLDAPLNYQFQYSGSLSATSIRHTRFSWTPSLYYSLYHDVVQSNTVDKQVGGFPTGVDSIAFVDRLYSYALYTRDAANVVTPLPYNFLAGGSYFAQHVTQDFSESAELHRIIRDSVWSQGQPRTTILRDAPEHRNFETNLGWGWSKGMLGTYLPTGGGLWGTVHKYWATYRKDFIELDSVNSLSLSQQGKSAPLAVFSQKQYDPWSVDGGTAGMISVGKAFSLFANAEAGSFLNKFPTVATPVHSSERLVNGTVVVDTVFEEQPEPGLWVLSYRLGYYRMSGYPYNFNYRGRDIMAGSSFAFGQYGIQVPLKAGTFLPGLPTTSLKQFMLTAMGEWGTTLETRPEHIVAALENGEHHLLLDFGLRLSANFKLYHQLPCTIFGQVFVPYNALKAANLYSSDYPRTQKRPGESDFDNDARDRKNYIGQVQDPRFVVGFNLGLF
ncbi:MAG: Tol biopolymer transport system periplasmic component [Fibrobacteres bacterium]|nr:Tol biopolymer transport system periplasmic component [Fibrobacterota bacterium]